MSCKQPYLKLSHFRLTRDSSSRQMAKPAAKAICMICVLELVMYESTVCWLLWIAPRWGSHLASTICYCSIRNGIQLLQLLLHAILDHSHVCRNVQTCNRYCVQMFNVCIRTWSWNMCVSEHGILGTRIGNIRVGMLGNWSMCVCVLDLPRQDGGLAVYTGTP